MPTKEARTLMKGPNLQNIHIHLNLQNGRIRKDCCQARQGDQGKKEQLPTRILPFFANPPSRSSAAPVSTMSLTAIHREFNIFVDIRTPSSVIKSNIPQDLVVVSHKSVSSSWTTRPVPSSETSRALSARTTSCACSSLSAKPEG